MWAKWPASSEVAIGVIVGIDLLFSGWSMIGLALRARGVGRGGVERRRRLNRLGRTSPRDPGE